MSETLTDSDLLNQNTDENKGNLTMENIPASCSFLGHEDQIQTDQHSGSAKETAGFEASKAKAVELTED